jgi:thiol-disulfide isomerase/thioredoxin
MGVLPLLIFSVAIFCTSETNGQAGGRSNRFTINGRVIGRDTGTIVLWYNDQKNDAVSDTIRLNKGVFRFSGTVNRVCEAYLWTDEKNKVLDDPTVVRFLLGPGNISIHLTKGDESKVIIKGSRSEIEKQDWDKRKSSLLAGRAQLYENLYSLYKRPNVDTDPILRDTVNKIGSHIDSINSHIRQLDLAYIKEHLNSYLSGYLLSRHKRKLSVDSVQMYYVSLSKEVQKSSVGYDVLDYVYPLTEDQEFRKLHPLIDLDFDERLRKVNSVYEFTLSDSSGVTVDFNSLKSKYLVIDFWASWCKPCIANIPAMNQMINEYKSDSIQFISVSLDKDLTQWRQSLAKNKFAGVQLSDPNGFKGLIAIYCKVLWVPKYIIADKNGQIINYDAPQPSEPDLRVLLDGMVNKR